MSHQDAALRQALAVAIVRNKRRWIQETNELREKTRHLEAELAKQQGQQEQLKQWVATVWQQDSTAHGDRACLGELPKVQHSGIFLPPLELGRWKDDQLDQGGTGSFQALRQQVLLAAAAGDSYSALAQVVDGKAATLSRMLLTNIQMLQRLSSTQPGQPSTADTNRSAGIPGPLAQGHASEIVSSISSFITSNLLTAPLSSLSTEYMKQSAAALAAVLTPPGAGSSSLAATSPTAEQCPGQRQQHEQAECDTAEALASQVVQLMQQLIVQKSAACLDVTGTSTGSSQTSAAATVMLQQLSTFPSTAVLLCVAVAQGLQQHVQLLKDSSAVIMSIKPANLGSATAAGEEALLAASQALEASYELLTDLEHAVMQIPAWGVALSRSTWTPRALEDLVGSAASMYRSCTGLQAEQPLLAGRMCSLCSSLATALQQLAADGEAPGMSVGLGAELRSVTAGLCMQLRDLFMPTAC